MIYDNPLEELMSNENITEIIVNRFDQIYFEYNGKLEPCHKNFVDEDTYVSFVKNIVEEAQFRLNLESPFASFLWKDFRVHIVHPPLNPQGFSVSFRRLLRENALTLADMKKWGSSKQILNLKDGLKSKKNILVVGATGSGKTTTLSALLTELDPCERVVVLEDTDEIILPNASCTKLLTRSGTDVLKDFNLGDLLKESLRMRPDRLVVGEVRGPEAANLLMALATGHKGSMATLHASSPQEALMRLEMLIQMGCPHWSLDSIRRLISLTVDWIVVVGKISGKRKLQGIYQISSLESFGFLVDLVEDVSASPTPLSVCQNLG